MQSEYRNGIWHRKICRANNEKRKKRNNGRNWIPKSRKNQNVQKKKNYKYCGILEADAIKQVDIKKKKRKYLRGKRKLLYTKLGEGINT